MTDDQQAGTLAFLQNFYTGVTLYMPFGAEERATVAAQPVPAAPQPAPAAALATPVAAAPVPKPVLPATAAAPVVTAPAKPPVPPLPPMPPARPAASLVVPVVPPVVAAAGAPPVAAAPAADEVPGYLRTTFDTLGSNRQGVVLLVRLPDAQFQKLPRNVFLNKLLQAIQLVMADVVLVNLHGPYPVALDNLRREIAATQVLAFGKNLLDVAIRTTQIYEPVQFPSLGLNYLAAAEIEMVEYDVSLKKRLWAGLKAMFL